MYSILNHVPGSPERTSNQHGGEYKALCPFCQMPGDLTIWPIRGQWGTYYAGCIGAELDAVDYMRRRYPSRYDASRERLILGPFAPDPGDHYEDGFEEITLQPPGERWQQKARLFVDKSKKTLWSPTGAYALGWLKVIGLSEATIRRAGLGYNPTCVFEPREAWGLPPIPERKQGGYVKLAPGIVIPHEISGMIWNVRVRVAKANENDLPCYEQIAGTTDMWTTDSLYNADALHTSEVALVLEDELEALLIQQELGDVFTPVATRDERGARRLQWYHLLSGQRSCLVAFSNFQVNRQWTQNLMIPSRSLRKRWWAVDALRGHLDELAGEAVDILQQLYQAPQGRRLTA